MGNTGGGGTAGPDDLGVLFHLNDSLICTKEQYFLLFFVSVVEEGFKSDPLPQNYLKP